MPIHPFRAVFLVVLVNFMVSVLGNSVVLLLQVVHGLLVPEIVWESFLDLVDRATVAGRGDVDCSGDEGVVVDVFGVVEVFYMELGFEV